MKEPIVKNLPYLSIILVIFPNLLFSQSVVIHSVEKKTNHVVTVAYELRSFQPYKTLNVSIEVSDENDHRLYPVSTNGQIGLLETSTTRKLYYANLYLDENLNGKNLKYQIKVNDTVSKRKTIYYHHYYPKYKNELFCYGWGTTFVNSQINLNQINLFRKLTFSTKTRFAWGIGGVSATIKSLPDTNYLTLDLLPFEVYYPFVITAKNEKYRIPQIFAFYYKTGVINGHSGFKLRSQLNNTDFLRSFPYRVFARHELGLAIEGGSWSLKVGYQFQSSSISFNNLGIRKSKFNFPFLTLSIGISSFGKTLNRADKTAVPYKTIKKTKIKPHIYYSKVYNKTHLRKTASLNFNLDDLPIAYKVKVRPIFEYIVKYSTKYDIDPYLVIAIIQVESGFNPRARARHGLWAGDYGLMQLNTKWGGKEAYQYIYKKFGEPSCEILYDPEKNIELGTAYLFLIKNKYFQNISDNEKLAYALAASYNAGAYRVDSNLRTIQDLGVIDSQTFERTILRDLKPETKQYVRRVIDVYRYINEY